MTGCVGVDRLAPAARGVDPAAVAVALPVQRRLGAGVLHERGVRAVGDRGSIDLEGGQLDRVARALVVVGEAARRRRRSRTRPAGDRDHLRAVGDRLGGAEPRSTARRQLVALDQLQQLQHRLVVLQLVGEQHLVDEPVPQQRVLGVGADLDPSSTSRVRSRTSAM